MLGLAHTMIPESLHHQDFLERCCVGFETMEAYVPGAGTSMTILIRR